jgi:hypothetical protein
MKIVKFADGTFGVRKGWLFKKYLSHNGYWWSETKTVVDYCRYATHISALEAAQLHSLQHIVIQDI